MLIYVNHVYHSLKRLVASSGDRRHDNRRARTGDKPGRCSPSRRFVRSLDPKRPIEGSVLDGFADVLGGDRVGEGEVGDGAGNFQDAVVGAGAQV
jgi:hypothetical protein